MTSLSTVDMSSSASKKKKDLSQITAEFRIVESQLRNSQYKSIITDMEVSPTHSVEWFSYGRGFHPFGVYNVETGEMIHEGLGFSEMKIESNDSSAPAITLSCSPAKGIFWYKVLVPHIIGKIKLTLRMKNSKINCSSLSWEINVHEKRNKDKDKDKDISSNKKTAKRKSSIGASTKTETVVAKELESPSKVRILEDKPPKSVEVKDSVTVASITETEPENEPPQAVEQIIPPNTEPLEAAIEESRVSKRFAALQQEKTHTSITVSSNVPTVPAPVTVGRRELQVIPLRDEANPTLPYPNANALTPADRLERPTGTGGDANANANTLLGHVLLTGPKITLELPPAIVNALRDDHSNITALTQAIREEIGTDDIKAFFVSSQIKYLNANEVHPTVNEVLLRLQDKCIHIQESNKIIQAFRNTFEYYFYDRLLHVIERRLLSQAIRNRRNTKFGDSFGVIFLLRLIVLIVMGADKQQQVKIADKNNNELEEEEEEEEGASLHEKCQDILTILVKDLNEHAHVLF